MQSKITIESIFGTGELFILVNEAISSPDMRDRAIQAFRERLYETSSWFKFERLSEVQTQTEDGVKNYRLWRILPITPHELRKEAELMMAIADKIEFVPTVNPQPQATH